MNNTNMIQHEICKHFKQGKVTTSIGCEFCANDSVIANMQKTIDDQNTLIEQMQKAIDEQKALIDPLT